MAEWDGKESALARQGTAPRPSLGLILGLAFALVAATPVIVITLWLRAGVESSILSEAHDKNQLLSQNLATPVSEYLTAARRNLALLGGLHDRHPRAFADTATSQSYFRELVYWSWGSAKAITWGVNPGSPFPLPAVLRDYPRTGGAAHTGVMRDPLSGQPTVFFLQPVRGGVLAGALDLAPIRALCGEIHFGTRGHCAMTDQFGNVVAHPNPAWVDAIKNLRQWPIVTAGMAGDAGVMTFYSPFIKAEMIAGYASVPDFHWVILTPQPLSELRAEASALVKTGSIVALAGLAVSLALAAFLRGWLSRAIGSVAEGVKKVQEGEYKVALPRFGRWVPREIETLRACIVGMSRSVREAISLKDNLNQELEQRVVAATRELVDANYRLALQAHVDDLTGLGNRRSLWQIIADLEQPEETTYLPVGLILLDIDRFKQINDTHGHATGDRVLVHVARIISTETREGDYVIRYAGDEFLILLTRCDLDTAQRRAESIRARIAAAPLPIEGNLLEVTASIGVTGSAQRLTRATLVELTGIADQAMYMSKRAGRNRISTVNR